ncbi:MAG: WG repeat-containing protein [Clostridiales bacterium]|nr:WG repeat-containing protein [Clostridiales bacterium]
MAIDPAWEMAWMFCEGLASVKSEGKWGFIDRRGNVVIGPRWEIVSQFENGIAPVRKGGVEGYINTSGEPVCGVKLD